MSCEHHHRVVDNLHIFIIKDLNAVLRHESHHNRDKPPQSRRNFRDPNQPFAGSIETLAPTAEPIS